MLGTRPVVTAEVSYLRNVALTDEAFHGGAIIQLHRPYCKWRWHLQMGSTVSASQT
jgi:hypothetical protein